MKKIKKLFAEKSYIISLFFLFVFFIVLFQFMLLTNIDDNTYSVIANTSTDNIIYFLKYHYGYCNSRVFVHALLILLLKFDVYAWRIFMPLCFCFFPVLICSFLSGNKDDYKKNIPVTVLAVFLLSSPLYETTLFWAAGSMNYIFPAFLISALLACIKKQKFKYFQPVLALMCGATTEQYGIITVAAILMILLHRVFIEKNKKVLLPVLNLLFSIAGYLTILFAPAIGNRQYKDSLTFLEKLGNLFFNIWFNNSEMSPFILFLGVMVSVSLIIYNKGILRKLSMIYGAVFLSAFVLSRLNIRYITPLCILFTALLLIGGMILSAIQFAAQKYYVPLGALLLGGGAQFMMAFTQRVSLRITMPSVFCFMVFAVSAFIFSSKNNRDRKKADKVILAAAMVILVSVAAFNAVNYINFTEYEAKEAENGKYAEVWIDEPQTREDVEAVIDRFEEVRLDNIEDFNSIG